jgi:cyclic beta-1,2-glucan synthetase
VTTQPTGVLVGIYGDARTAKSVFPPLVRRGVTRHRTATLVVRDTRGILSIEQSPGASTLGKEEIQRYSSYLINDEALILISTDEDDMEDAFHALRQQRNGRPVTFIFHPPLEAAGAKLALGQAEPPLSSAPVSGDQLEEEAVRFAYTFGAVNTEHGSDGTASRIHLMRSLRASAAALLEVRQTLAVAMRLGQVASLAGEWLLDNSIVLKGQSEDVLRSLTPGFFSHLPLLVEGDFKGLPRAYALAAALVGATDARIERSGLLAALQGFQSITPLQMSELWALPLLLRLRLILLLRELALQVDRRQRERELADFWASRLLVVSRRAPERLEEILTLIKTESPHPTPHLADQLIGHLNDDETSLLAVRAWLEESTGETLADLVQQGQREQAMEQVTLSNAIGSLRQLATLDWRHVFEAASLVHTVLSSDPAGVYSRMEFATRDLYRHAVEQVARDADGTSGAEIEVAEAACAMARLGEDDLRRNVGYYLIDKGRTALESRVNAHPDSWTRARRWARRHPALVYAGGVAVLTAVFAALVASWAGSAGTSPYLLLLLIPLALFPLSELAIQVLNFALTRLMPPEPLPRMDYSETGIPDACRTLVVVPMMLLTREAIAVEVERLEIRYLANPDPNLRYALLSDYADAPLQHMPEDAERLDAVVRGVEQLNERYGAGRFFLFQRERSWSASEERWIGWERKRGKLEQMNAFLMNEHTPELAGMLRVGERQNLNSVRFVITLDADTQLPRDTARRLVGTMSHPLNRPRLTLDGLRVDRGYTLIQPLVSTVLPSATETFFTRLFTPPAGTDPYTNVISDVYQDLAGEGSYHGKGIYDLAVFHRVVGKGRLPEAHLLSHDLLEGGYVRVGLATDIELFDQFPRDYISYARRQHRWVRGDWQIVDWLLQRVPTGKGRRETNPVSYLTRWKIFDNLRRSMVPIASALLLLAGWIFTPAPGLWSLLIGSILIVPILITLVLNLLSTGRTDSRLWSEFSLQPLRALAEAALLPYQALLNGNAITLVVERRLTSRLLLEWETASESVRRSRDRHRQFLIRLLWVPVLAATVFLVLLAKDTASLVAALPFLLAWACAPIAVSLLSRTRSVRTEAVRALDSEDRALLRRVARQTWRYFDDFVGESSLHLPPDNYQEFEGVGIAPRTSPTNIGLWLLSAVAAHDFGFQTLPRVIARTGATLETMDTLEKYEGNLLNWYDTTKGAPLHPRYVSFVDSGNLLGSLWTLSESYRNLANGPLLSVALLRGMGDTLALLREAMGNSLTDDTGNISQSEALDAVERLCRVDETIPGAKSLSLEMLVRRLRELTDPVERISQHFITAVESTPLVDASGDVEQTAESIAAAASAGTTHASLVACRYWASKLQEQVREANTFVNQYLGWVELLAASPDQGLFALGQDAHEWRRIALETAPSLRALAQGDVPGLAPLVGIRQRGEALQIDSATRDWLNRLHYSADQARLAADELLQALQATLDRSDRLARDMKLKFMYVPERRIFSIGYSVEDRRLDNSYYDLLASESRLGSFCAIARGEVPMEHWWALGRSFGEAFGKRALMSWSGTMFEYLMPNLVMRAYDKSLITEAIDAAIACQISYGKRNGIPWGISEAAYSALDAGHTYQYYAFGVPELGMKRSLDEGLVVAPYASALALPYAPGAAIENLRHLATLGMRGDRGFYESIDYSRQRGPSGERGMVVQAYMAHHQGMALLAIDNALHEGILQDRFHADGRVLATESLLHERIPIAPPLSGGDERAEAPLPHGSVVLKSRGATVAAASDGSARGVIDRPDTLIPRVHLLSNGRYQVMVTNAGGGYSRWQEADITRWRADTTTDAYGSFLYVRDLERGLVWSAGFQPTAAVPSHYETIFTAERAEIRRRDHGIETITEIVVSPEDDAEVRRVTLMNRSGQVRRLELTTYAEVALAPHAADRAHPAFSKLFISTEALRESPNTGDAWALLAGRRPRSAKEQTYWSGHLICIAGSDSGMLSSPSFETNRTGFLGRGRTARQPIVMDSDAPAHLGGGVGPVLDPVFSLRRTITLAPGQRVQIAIVTVAGSSRESVVALVEKYRDYGAARRAFQLAWNRAQLELRHLRVGPDEAQRFLQLASSVLYPNPMLRAPQARLERNTQGQAGLWKYGISGDLPIVVVQIRDLYDAYVVRELLIAHTYWRLHSLRADLVILNEEGASYDLPLQGQLGRLVQAHTQYTGIDQPGGVFLRPARDIPEADMDLLLAAARVVIVAARGSLAQQLASAITPTNLPALLEPTRAPEKAENGNVVALPEIERIGWNGWGGFTTEGTEYAIDLLPGHPTPAPWINVMASEHFGTLVTESGAGYSWYGNSQSNRLTPWTNDPTSDPISDGLYLRDEETGQVWSPTPSPKRSTQTAYRVRHGQGYTRFENTSSGIEQELSIFVPLEETGEGAPVRLQVLRLRNASAQKRRLTATPYAAWTLGVEREDTQMHVVTSWEDRADCLLARCAYRENFADRVAFLASSLPVASYTGDRTEFLGRNGTTGDPAALHRVGLSGRVGGGLDACGALQVAIDLEPNDEIEVVFLMGEAANPDEVHKIVQRFREPGVATTALETTKSWWNQFLSKVEVEIPEQDGAEIGPLLNRWLLYQGLSCRVWGRSAFYQSGGAFGFRDQLQDVLALLYAAPQIARTQIIGAAARQFLEGDVQHWWHPPAGGGVRTRISDDLLWLPFAVAQYVRVTGDDAILDEEISFISGKELGPEDHEAYFVPDVTEEKATLLEHCRRALKKGLTASELHGLPLIGGGDWNDGLNRVGIDGKGESVWLAWFIVHVLQDFAELLELRDGQKEAEEARTRAQELTKTIDETAWDGAWYRRAYFDDGTPLGSQENDEAKIDSLSQSWAVIVGTGDPERASQALDSAAEHLFRPDPGMMLLFTPPLDKTSHDPGYIKGYVPGVRENGGQYTHGSLWMPLAFARRGDGDKAVEILHAMSPTWHTRSPEETALYKVEPYVVVADIYALEGQVGRGGWTWYTGSSGWMYRVWLEEVLGLKVRGDGFTLEPCIPTAWDGFTLRYRHGKALYEITVTNPDHISRGIAFVEQDGNRLPDNHIPFANSDTEATYKVTIQLGQPSADTGKKKGK